MKTKNHSIVRFIIRLVILNLLALVGGSALHAASLTWTGAVNSDWNNTNNWLPVVAPTYNDTVTINSGNVSATATSQFGTLNFNGGSLSGTLTVASGKTINWTSGSIAQDGALTLGSGGQLTMSTAGDKRLFGVITNAGMVVWSGNAVWYYSRQRPARIVNLAGGVFEAQNDQPFADPGYGGAGSAVFDNYGIFRKRIGTGTTSFDGGVLFNNTGTVDVQSGTLSLGGGGSLAGAYSIASDAKLVFAGGIFTPGSGTIAVTGGGLVRVSGGAMTANLASPVSQWEVTGGDAGVNGTITNLSIAGGSLHGTNLVVSTMSWTAGSIAQDGALTVGVGGQLNMSTAGDKRLFGVITNGGTMVWSGNAVWYYSRQRPARIVNLAGGVFEAQNDQPFADPGYGGAGSAVFDNYGIFRKRIGTGTTSFDGGVLFNNTGTVDVQSGTLSLGGGGSLAGAYSIASDAKLVFAGGIFTPGSGTIAVTGGGLVRVSGGAMTANLASPVSQWEVTGGDAGVNGTITNLSIAGGSLHGTNLVVSTMSWTAGSIAQDGALTVGVGGQLNMSTAGDKRLFGVITNGGTMVWSGNAVWYYSRQRPARIVNLAGGVFEAQNDQSFADAGYGGAGSAVFDNYGIFRKRIGTGTTSFDGGVLFNNTGTVDVKSGTLSLGGGGSLAGAYSIASDAKLVFAGGIFTPGSGTIAVTGGGLVRVSGGAMTANLASPVSQWEVTGGDAGVNGTITNLSIAGGSLHGTNLVVSTMSWTAGSIAQDGALTVGAGGQLNMSTAGDKRLFGVITNGGTMVWAGNAVWYYSRQRPARIVNLAGGVFEAQNDQSFADAGYGGASSVVFDNYGIFRKRIGTGTTSLDNGVLFNNTGTVDVQSGTLSLGGGGSLAGAYSIASDTKLVFAGGTFTPGSGTIAVTGAGLVRVSGGAMTANLASPVSQWEVTGGDAGVNGTVTNLSLAGGSLHGTNLVVSAMSWTAGSIAQDGAVTVGTGGQLNMSTTGDKRLFGVITNGGTAVWAGNAVWYYSRQRPARIVNLVGGVFEAQNDQSFADAGYGGASSVVFDNYGIFRKRIGTGTTSLDNGVLFNNTGTVDVQSGTLSLGGGGLLAGAYSVASDTKLVFAGGTFTPGSGTIAVTGAGLVRVSGGAMTANLASPVSQWEVTGGDAGVNGTVTNLSLAGGSLHGTNLVVSAMSWTAGSIAQDGAVTVGTGGQLNMSTTGDKRLFGVITNGGTAVWAGNAVWYYSRQRPARIVNLVGGVFEAQNDQSFADAGYGGASSVVFDNYGIFRKRIGTGTTSLDNGVLFNNTGTVDVQSGTLSLGGGGSLAGAYSVASDTKLVFAGGTFTPSSGSIAFTGGGLVRVSGGAMTTSLASPVSQWEVTGGDAGVNGTVTNLSLAGGSLHGTNLVVSAMSWTAGSIAQDGAVTVGTGGQLNMSTTGDKRLFGVITNGGTAVWAGNAVWYYSRQRPARIVNLVGGVFEAQNDQSFADAGYGGASSVVFDNYGIFRKRIGTGTTSLDNGVLFNNTGTVDVQSGTLSLGGAYTMTGGGVTFGFTSATNFGKVNVVGSATITGGLVARLLGGYVPAIGTAFPVMTFGSRIGSFTDTNGLYAGSQRYFETAYTATTLTLTSRYTNDANAAPLITSQPMSQTNIIGSTATFSVTATGAPPLSYQWRKNGAPLANAGNISGANSNLLTLASVTLADAANYDVVVTNVAGSATSTPLAVLAVLTNAPSIRVLAANFVDVDWSPDGSSMAATRNDNTIWTIRSDGANPVQITTNYSWFPLYRPNSTQLYYFDNLDVANWLISTEAMGGGARNKIMMVPGGDSYSSVSFAPDGSQFAFLHLLSQQPLVLKIASADGTGVQKILTNGTLKSVSWGRGVSSDKFAVAKLENGINAVFVMNSDGSRLARVTPVEMGECSTPHWTPSGGQLAIARKAAGETNRQIWLINADSTGTRMVTSDAFDSTQPKVSPDGSRIAYISTRNGTNYICVATLNPAPTSVYLVPESLKLLGDGHWQFSVTGPLGQVLEIQASTNLLDWGSIGTVAIPAGEATFTDPAVAPASRFYRAKIGSN